MKRTILRLALNPALALVLAAAIPAAAGAAAYADYAINWPAGWVIEDPDVQGMAKAKSPVSQANCNSYTRAIPDLAQKSQAQLNADLTAPWGAAEWASISGVPQDKIEMVSSNVRSIGAQQLRIGTFRVLPGAIANQPGVVVAHLGVTLTPGKLYYAGCYGQPADFTANRQAMEATIASLRPR